MLKGRAVGDAGVRAVLDLAGVVLIELRPVVVGPVPRRRKLDAPWIRADIVDRLIDVLPQFIECQIRPPRLLPLL